MYILTFSTPEMHVLTCLVHTVRIGAVQRNWRYDRHFTLAQRTYRVVGILAGSVHLITNTLLRIIKTNRYLAML